MNEIYGKTRFRGAIGEATLPRDFAILTAFATTGETWSAERNLRANETLRLELQERGCWMVEATGYSPEDGHAEPGWAVEIPLDDALELGRKYLQDAIYFVRAGELSVWSCAQGASESVALGPFDVRVDRMSDEGRDAGVDQE